MTTFRYLVFAAAIAAATAVGAQHDGPELDPLLSEGFETPGDDGLPEGWTMEYGDATDLAIQDTHAHSGQRSLWLCDRSDDAPVGLRSPKVPVEPGQVYGFNAWWLAEAGRSASIYIEFWDADGNRMSDHVTSHGVVGRGQWMRRSGSVIAPEGAAHATVLLYSWSSGITEGWFDDIEFGPGALVEYDRTPRPPAEVDHPVGLYSEEDIARALRNIELYQWARDERDAIIDRARWWMELPAEAIEEWIPEGTPFRVCDCPNCGATWGVDPWTFIEETGETQCKRCGTRYPNEDFPETGVEEYINPLGEIERISFYEDANGKKYRLEGLRKYHRVLKLTQLGWLGRAYALTGDVAYAERVREVLLRLAQVYPAYIAHDWYRIYPDYSNLQSGKLSGWKLHDANALIELSIAYDLTAESGVYSDEDRSIIEEGVFREGGRLITTTSPRGCCVNDGPFLMAAGGYIGKLLGRHDYVAWAIEPPDGFFGFVEENFWRDGHWEDSSPSYESMALAKFYVLPEILHGYSDPPDYDGVGCYDNLDMFGHPLMSKVLVAGEYVTAPDGHQPPINDSTFGAGHSSRHAEENYFWFPTERNRRIMVHAYGGDPNDSGGGEYALFRRDPEADFSTVEPLNLGARSLVRPGLGLAILRAGEGAEQAMVALDYGPIRGHAHPDKLNWLFYAHETELVTDLGYLGARHPLMPWLRACAAHNEVLVDGDAQRKVAGELLGFVPGQFAQSIRAEAPDVHELAEVYERTLTLIAPPGGPPYVVDVFDVVGGERNLMAFHADGETFETTASMQPFDEQFITKAAEGGDWIRTQSRAFEPGAFSSTWRVEPDNELGVRLTVLDEPAVAYHITAPGLRDRSSPWADRTLNVMLWEQPGPAGRFVSVAEAIRGEPQLGEITGVETSRDDVTGISVERGDVTDYVFVGSDASVTAETVCEAPAGLRFVGRQAVVSVDDRGPVFAQLVDGSALTVGELALKCQVPTSGTIVAFDEDRSTITTDAALPAGAALRGHQLFVRGRVDGAYEIDRVEATADGTVVHLSDEPIMRVEVGDEAAVSSVAEVRRLDDGSWTVRANCEVEAALPRPEGFNSRVMLRTADGWTRLAHETANGSVRFHIDPALLRGDSATLLLTNAGEVDLTDDRPPVVERVIVDGRAFAGDDVCALGFLQDPRVIVVELRDAANPLSLSAFHAWIEGHPDARIDASIHPRLGQKRLARAIVRLRELPPGQYTLRLTFYDGAANEGEAAISFNTRGWQLKATELRIVEDSGKLSKPLGGLDTQFYRAEGPGDYVVYEFEVPQDGVYDVSLVATGYPSYGTYQASIDGRPVGEPIVGWRPALDPGGIVADLGRMRLQAGTHQLRLEVVGHDENASDYFIGWQSLALRPVVDGNVEVTR